jgi:hypothetical protein
MGARVVVRWKHLVVMFIWIVDIYVFVIVENDKVMIDRVESSLDVVSSNCDRFVFSLNLRYFVIHALNVEDGHTQAYAIIAHQPSRSITSVI